MWPRLLTVAVGIWLMAAPAVLGFPAAPLASSVAAGVAVLALTPWIPGDPDRFGGGWRSLVD